MWCAQPARPDYYNLTCSSEAWPTYSDAEWAWGHWLLVRRGSADPADRADASVRARHRQITLALLAHACLAVMRARAAQTGAVLT
jgi:hypothetical protein